MHMSLEHTTTYHAERTDIVQKVREDVFMLSFHQPINRIDFKENLVLFLKDDLERREDRQIETARNINLAELLESEIADVEHHLKCQIFFF